MNNSDLAAVIVGTLVDEKKIRSREIEDTTTLVLDKLNEYRTTVDEDRDKTFVKATCEKDSTDEDGGSSSVTRYGLKHSQVIPGTMKGIVYRRGVAIQSFRVTDQGQFLFNNIGQPSDTTALTGKMNQWRGEVSFSWNTSPGPTFIEVSYDYNTEKKKRARGKTKK